MVKLDLDENGETWSGAGAICWLLIGSFLTLVTCVILCSYLMA